MILYFHPSDDEQLAGQWQDSHFDEDAGWWNGLQQCGATLALAAALLVATATTLAAQQVFSQSQDDPAGSLTTQALVQEEYWQNPVAPVNWPQPSVLTDDDVHPTFVAVFTPDDGDWQAILQLPPATQANNYIQLPFLDPEEIPVGSFSAVPNPVDDSAVWVPQPAAYDPDWTLPVYLDDGSWVLPFEPDEDFLPAQSLPAPLVWSQPPQPLSATDDLIPQFPSNDDFWPQYVTPDPGGLLWTQQWTFEQNEPGNLVSFAQEDYWQNPTAAVADSLYLFPQWPFETNDPAGSLTLTLDDSFVPNFVPPDPGSFIWTQQWSFEQNEPLGFLVPFHDEDFWTPQVPPVVWPQPSVFLADELVVPQSSATIDEVYFSQLVAPVPASLYQNFPYLPDAETMYPTLSTPIPPPPPAPCVMPAGFDADTSVSTFSNFKGGPILALFCRLCMSGRPLLVRGDYAIWCQDCCAFVSKQDTFMGTVQAPGQFRARF